MRDNALRFDCKITPLDRAAVAEGFAKSRGGWRGVAAASRNGYSIPGLPQISNSPRYYVYNGKE